MTIKLKLTQGQQFQARVKPGVPGPVGPPGDNGTNGIDGAQIFVQNSAPATIWREGSLWIDADSTDLDLYTLTAGAWADTGKNLKGEAGDQIFVQNSEPATSGPEGSLWIDKDSADLDLYTLTAGAWVDTTTNLKGAPGGTPAGADTQIQYNGTGSFAANAALTFNSSTKVLGGTDLVITPSGAGGLQYTTTNPVFTGSSTFASGCHITNVLQDPLPVDPIFSNVEGLTVEYSMNSGQNVYQGGTNSKVTAFGIKQTMNAIGAGQRFGYGNNVNAYGMGDVAGSVEHIRFAGGDIAGDEGQGFTLVNTCLQQQFRALYSISSVPTQSTINTTTTQVITASKNSQTVNVASSTGVIAGQWVVIEQQVASGTPNIEAVQVSDVPSGTSITGIFRCNHANGVTVTPALVLNLDNSNFLGEQRVLVNLSGTSYTTGTVASIAGGTFTGSGTTWANNMVGGSATNIGAISLTNDDFAGAPFNGGNGPLKSWYQITGVASATSLGIHSFSVAGDQSYRGNGVGAGAYTVRPAARVLKVSGSTVICETSAHTWTAAHNLELAICPYPDISGFQYHFGTYTPGTTARDFMKVSNFGSREFETCFKITSSMPSGSDPHAFNTALYCDAPCDTVLVAAGATSSAIRLGGASPSGANGRITWTAKGTFIEHNVTNEGITIAGTDNHTSTAGELFFKNAAVSGTSVEEMDWKGLLLASQGFRLPISSVSALPSAATFLGTKRMVNDANATTFHSIVAGGGSNTIPVYSDGTNWRIG